MSDHHGGPMTDTRERERLAKMIEGRSAKCPLTGCWFWLGYVNPKGYGRVMVGPRAKQAHRVSYEIANGPIPAGLVLDHICRQRSCVNPAHLEPVTNRENLMRGDTIVSGYAARTHCTRGHALVEGNLRSSKGAAGARGCLQCYKDSDRRRKRSPEYRSRDNEQRRIAYANRIALTASAKESTP